ncbi:hypothetical protein [Hymenobacter perfusus]|uniref:Uncharacterized protein n=1 Tax=Hymenobacter perfusus TaxID=1236770 RepID=A0A3R9MZQ9_9BACT|nr:hypothetical protein [Hymenobacter perfusus]RSK44679.1 hypothetical protein EI293_09215 [Hymenobacter perfusus]
MPGLQLEGLAAGAGVELVGGLEMLPTRAIPATEYRLLLAGIHEAGGKKAILPQQRSNRLAQVEGVLKDLISGGLFHRVWTLWLPDALLGQRVRTNIRPIEIQVYNWA